MSRPFILLVCMYKKMLQFLHSSLEVNVNTLSLKAQRQRFNLRVVDLFLLQCI